MDVTDYIHSVEPLPNWLFGMVRGKDTSKEKPESIDKCKVIIEQVGRLFEKYPDYSLYITGHSLGAALATLFSVEVAASNDPRINKPITCISNASPKTGNVEFQWAVSTLEEQRKLHCLRVANASDAITWGPGVDPCIAGPTAISCPRELFQHVGIKLKLKPITSKEHFTLEYSRPPESDSISFRCDELMKQVWHFLVSLVLVPYVCLCFCKAGSDMLKVHGSREYINRLQAYNEELNKTNLNEVYNKMVKEDLYEGESYLHES